MKGIAGVFLILLAAWVSAEPVVIADLGGRETGLKSPQEQLLAVAKNMPPPLAPTRPSLRGRYPIESSLSVGIIDNYAHNKPVSRPFFIVGFDEQSAQWLDANKHYLLEIDALGFVTNVRSEAQLEKLQSYAGDLVLNALPVDAIADQFDLSFYPVLITHEEIIQ